MKHHTSFSAHLCLSPGALPKFFGKICIISDENIVEDGSRFHLKNKYMLEDMTGDIKVPLTLWNKKDLTENTPTLPVTVADNLR